MIFCKELLFIHVPKTGGMSLTRYLLDVLPKPVFYSLPPSHLQDHEIDPSIVVIPGTRHETLEDASTVVSAYGYDLRRFLVILAVMRNPYSLESSRYAYLQMGYPWDKGRNQELALAGDFEVFAAESVHGDSPSKSLESYFLLDGKVPENLVIVKFEDLAQGMKDALQSIGIRAPADLPWVNESHHEHFLTFYTKRAEESVYRKYRWAFDSGFYTRIDRRYFDGEGDTPFCVGLPLVGPVGQVGPSSGLAPDLSITSMLKFKVRVHRATERLLIVGTLPQMQHPGIDLTLTVDGHSTLVSLQISGDISWAVPMALRGGSLVQVELTISRVHPPQDTPSSAAPPGFRLSRIVFGNLEDEPDAPASRMLSAPSDARMAALWGEDCTNLPTEDMTYQQLLPHLGRIIATRLPHGAKAVILGGMDDTFPLAIRDIEALRAGGVEFLIFPASAFGVLLGRTGLRSYLDKCYRRAWSDALCIMFDLTHSRDARSVSSGVS